MISLVENGKILFYQDEKLIGEVLCQEGVLHISQNNCVVTVVK